MQVIRKRTTLFQTLPVIDGKERNLKLYSLDQNLGLASIIYVEIDLD